MSDLYEVSHRIGQGVRHHHPDYGSPGPWCPACRAKDAALVELQKAVAEEREACADLCDQENSIEGIAQNCARAIRARGFEGMADG